MTVRWWIDTQSRQVTAEGAARTVAMIMDMPARRASETILWRTDHVLTDVAISSRPFGPPARNSPLLTNQSTF